jgi:predicted GNAT family N-acyltransferase
MTADRKYIVTTKKLPKADQLHHLFKQAEWAKNRTLTDTEKLLKKLDAFVAIWDEDRLIGFGRVLTDGVFRAVIDDVIVEESYRGKGVGMTIVKTLSNLSKGIEEVLLHAEKELEGFYGQFGFRLFHGITMISRADW